MTRSFSVLAVALMPAYSISAASSHGDALFVSEYLHLEISDRHLHLTGRYHFARGSSTENLEILYPIPGDVLTAPVRIVRALIRCDSGPEQPLSLSNWNGHLGWELPFERADSCLVTIQYEQRLATNRVEYALTTARGWPKPIEWAAFEIRLPAEATSVCASYPLSVSVDSSGVLTYTHVERHFVPERELVLEWSAR